MSGFSETVEGVVRAVVRTSKWPIRAAIYGFTIASIPLSWLRVMSHDWEIIALVTATVLWLSAVYELHKEVRKVPAKVAPSSDDVSLMAVARVVRNEVGAWLGYLNDVVTTASWGQYDPPNTTTFEDNQKLLASDGPMHKAASDAFQVFFRVRSRSKRGQHLAGDDLPFVMHARGRVEDAYKRLDDLVEGRTTDKTVVAHPVPADVTASAYDAAVLTVDGKRVRDRAKRAAIRLQRLPAYLVGRYPA